MALGMNNELSWLATATCLTLPLAAVAQANPAGPPATAPALRYESAFADYTPWQDIQPGDWRAINDALAKGPAGHGEHGEKPPAAGTPSSQPEKPANSRQAPVPMHDGHHMHGGQK